MMHMGMGAARWARVGAADGARGSAAMKLHCTSSATRERPWIGMEGRTGGWRGEGGLQGAGSLPEWPWMGMGGRTGGTLDRGGLQGAGRLPEQPWKGAGGRMGGAIAYVQWCRSSGS